MAFRALIQILVVAALVTGCGFHLRGKLPLPEQLKVIAVTGEDRAFKEEMVEALEASEAQVVDPAAARSVLELYDVTYERKVRTIDTRGKVTGYILSYRISYRVTDETGAVLRETTLALQRDYNFDPEQVLQAEAEEEELRENMVEELVQRIMRQLVTVAALSTDMPVRGDRAPA